MSKRIVALTGINQAQRDGVFSVLTGTFGKSNEVRAGEYYYKFNAYTLVNITGTYSPDFSTGRERLAAEYVGQGAAECTVCVVDWADAERSLAYALKILSLTGKAVVFVSLGSSGADVDSTLLSGLLGVPVVKSRGDSVCAINALLEQVHLIVTGAVKPQSTHADCFRAGSIVKAVTVVRTPESYKAGLPKEIAALTFAILILFVLTLFVALIVAEYARAAPGCGGAELLYMLISGKNL